MIFGEIADPEHLGKTIATGINQFPIVHNEYIQVSCTEKDGVLHSHFRYAGKDGKINRDADDSK